MPIEQIEMPVGESLACKLNELWKQMSPDVEATVQRLRASLTETVHNRIVLWIDRDSHMNCRGAIILTLCLLPYERRNRIEGLVVGKEYRGQGIGEALLDTAIKYARRHFAGSTLELCCNVAREAAGKVYAAAGFEKAESDVWRMKL